MATIEESQLNNATGVIKIPNYSQEFSTLSTNLTQLKASVDALTSALNAAIGPTSLPGSLGKITLAQAEQLKALNGLSTDGNKKTSTGFGALQNIASQLAGIASTLNNGVAATYLSVADQMNKNAFDKAATQAALTRNKLPEVAVSNTDFLTTLQNRIADAGNVAATAQATGFVTTQANAAIGAATSYITDLLPSPTTIFNNFKALLPTVQADTTGTVVQGEATVLKELFNTRTG